METIPYPKKDKGHGEIQALLWYFLRTRKVDARMEVTANHSRLDIVCFRNELPFCIIEVKSWSREYSKVRKYRLNNTKQLGKYKEMFGLPVFVCGRATEIDKTIASVLELV